MCQKINFAFLGDSDRKKGALQTGENRKFLSFSIVLQKAIIYDVFTYKRVQLKNEKTPSRKVC